MSEMAQLRAEVAMLRQEVADLRAANVVDTKRLLTDLTAASARAVRAGIAVGITNLERLGH